MEDTQQQEAPKITRKCALDGCNNEFTPSDSKHKYCSPSHRAKASRMNKRAGMGSLNIDDVEGQPAPQQAPQQSSNIFSSPAPKEHKEVAIPENISAAARFIIDTLTHQRDDWKRDYLEERDTVKKLLAERDALEKKVRDLQHEMELDQIRNEKPSGLGALSESPLMKELVPHIGPALGKFMMGLADLGTAKMGGASGGLPPGLSGLQQEIFSMLAGWLPKVSEETQQLLGQALVSLIQLDEENAKHLISNFLNLVERGTTAQPNGTWG